MLDVAFMVSYANLAMTKLPYPLWQCCTVTNAHYSGLSLHIATNKKYLSFLSVLTNSVCIQKPTQFVHNTEQYKSAQAIPVTIDACLCRWELMVYHDSFFNTWRTYKY
jgi:hypothetical protein